MPNNLFIDVDGFVITFNLGSIVRNFQKAFICRTDSQTHTHKRQTITVNYCRVQGSCQVRKCAVDSSHTWQVRDYNGGLGCSPQRVKGQGQSPPPPEAFVYKTESPNLPRLCILQTDDSSSKPDRPSPSRQKKIGFAPISETQKQSQANVGWTHPPHGDALV